MIPRHQTMMKTKKREQMILILGTKNSLKLTRAHYLSWSLWVWTYICWIIIVIIIVVCSKGFIEWNTSSFLTLSDFKFFCNLVSFLLHCRLQTTLISKGFLMLLVKLWPTWSKVRPGAKPLGINKNDYQIVIIKVHNQCSYYHWDNYVLTFFSQPWNCFFPVHLKDYCISRG